MASGRARGAPAPAKSGDGEKDRGARRHPHKVDEDVRELPRAPGDVKLDALVHEGDEKDERGDGKAAAPTERPEKPAEQDPQDRVLEDVGALADDEREEVAIEGPQRRQKRRERLGHGVALPRGKRAGNERVAPDKASPAQKEGAPHEGGAPHGTNLRTRRHASAARGTEKCFPT